MRFTIKIGLDCGQAWIQVPKATVSPCRTRRYTRIQLRPHGTDAQRAILLGR
jgi:hypothetical protein